MRLCILISVVCVLTAFGSAQPGPGFDPKEVVRQVHTRGDLAGLRSGDSERVPGSQSNRFPFHPTAEGRGRPAVGGEQFGGGAEFLLDTNSTLVPAPGHQNDPAIAFDGTNYLVVWEDLRSGNYTDIWGSRVTPEGTVLDTSGFVISQGANDQLYPAVGFDGANFLVVWEDYRGIWHSDIYGARVTPGGTVLDPLGFAISQALNDQSYPALAFDSANFLVVWEDYRNNDTSDIYGARVTPGGTVLDTSGFALVQAANGQSYPALGFGGTNFFVAWQDCRDSGTAYVYATLVTPGGKVVVPNGFRISVAPGLQELPAVGFDGTNFLVAWEDVQGSFPPDLTIYGARVTPGGTVLDPNGFAISGPAGNQFSPDVGFDGANFLVAWQNNPGGFTFDIYGARVTPDGTVLDRGGFVISNAADLQSSPAVGFDGANLLVVWQDYRNGSGYTDVYGARVTPEGTVIDTSGFVIPQSARNQLTPAVAFDGANFLVVWEDHRSGSPDIYGARVTSGGTVLDPDGIVISATAGWQLSPAIGFDGANFLVAWHDERSGNPDIYGARVTPEGLVLDPNGIAISQVASSQKSPALDFDGTNFLVAWQDSRAGTHNSDIYGARVTPGGVVLDPDGFVISSAAGDQFNPALGFDGTNSLVAWTDYRSGEYSDIYAARVTPQGTVRDPQGFVISQAPLNQSAPVIGFDGANSLLAWTDYRTGIYSDVFGARVTPQGTVLDPAGLGIARMAYGQVGPALGLGFDGANFLAVWEDYRVDHPDIYGALVTPAGKVVDTGAIVVQGGNQFHPALARGTDSLLFLVYQGWAGTVGDKTYNTDRIWGKLNPAPGSIEESHEPMVHGSRPRATVVRGVLYLDTRPSSSPSTSCLLDVSGRKMLDLKPGANDVRALAPGVYFVWDERCGAGDEGRTRKVVVQR